MKRRGGWLNFCIRETIGRRIGVGIEECRGNLVVARPETETAHFLRIGFARDRVRTMGNGAGMRRCAPVSRASYRVIEAGSDDVQRTAIAALNGNTILEVTI